MNFYNYSL